MHISFKFIILFFGIVFENGSGLRYEGDFCAMPSSESKGICKIITSCPSALQNIQTHNIFPKICGFKNNDPIICCAFGPDADTIAPIPSTRAPIPSTRAPISSTRAPIIIPTKRAKPKSTTIRILNAPSPTQNVILQVGDKSKQKCQEYGKYNAYEGNDAIRDPFNLPQTTSCAITEAAYSFIGPVPASAKEFPHMALIGFDGDNNTIHWDCSGSLISEKFVLSAAHCTNHKQLNREAKYILLGKLVLDSTINDAYPQKIPIKNILRHPNYRLPSMNNDIALFELQHIAILNVHVRPACLNTIPSLTNDLGIVTGWGRFTTYGDVRKEMQSVSFSMLSNTACNDRARANGIDQRTQLCAGSQNGLKDDCQGDTGGPLQIINEDVFCTHKIIGVTSLEKPCGPVNLPGVYTRVSAYIKWIEDIVWP